MRELRDGLDGRQLELDYQPQVRMRDGRIGAAEALLRWRHPRRGILLPGQFLPAAERTGTIKSVCEWALQRALEDCRGWNDAGFPLHVAVNVSGRNLRDPLLIEKISQMLGSSGLEPAALKLEIEESSVISDPHGAVVAMHRIQAAGVQLAIDDFGASGALLTSLKRLPVDEIKLAGGFVRDMVRDSRDAAIVRCTIDLGHSLGRRVVAQDVADAAAWQMLAEFGCDDAQGPYAGPTMAQSELTRWLAQPSRARL
jgi:EAL domain-containing protein (putative c-di-GMP-specific phosphodiesterase class I)